jgi:hypothetical protein
MLPSCRLWLPSNRATAPNASWHWPRATCSRASTACVSATRGAAETGKSEAIWAAKASEAAHWATAGPGASRRPR